MSRDALEVATALLCDALPLSLEHEVMDVCAVLTVTPRNVCTTLTRLAEGGLECRPVPAGLDDQSITQCAKEYRDGQKRLRQLIRDLGAAADLADAVGALLSRPEPALECAA